MKVVYSPQARQDYQRWQSTDSSMLTRVNQLIEVAAGTPFEGIGRPEKLKFGIEGAWTRRITAEHRLVYRVRGDDLQLLQLRYHY
ncbi:Txe/YoeB family addiction module toxin [Mycolicibacterium sp. Y3]